MASSTPGRRPRRPRNSLTADAILDAAELVAAEGLDGLTIRALATELDSSPMALYRYFATKDELVDAMLDRVLGRFAMPDDTDDWARDLAVFTQAHRQLLAAHPWAVPVLFSHPSPGVNAVRIGERALGILARGGLRGTEAVAAFSALLALNYGWSAFALARDPSAPVVDRAPDLTASLAALPADAFPFTAAAAGPMAEYGSDEQYDLALGFLLHGVSATGKPAKRRR
jgi:AcrR family transcriptional regulator